MLCYFRWLIDRATNVDSLKKVRIVILFPNLSGLDTVYHKSDQNLRFQKALQQLENPIKINHLKKEIAQLKTIKREFDLGLRSGKDGQ